MAHEIIRRMGRGTVERKEMASKVQVNDEDLDAIVYFELLWDFLLKVARLPRIPAWTVAEGGIPAR